MFNTLYCTLRECKDWERQPIKESRKSQKKAQPERKSHATITEPKSLPIRPDREAVGTVGTLDPSDLARGCQCGLHPARNCQRHPLRFAQRLPMEIGAPRFASLGHAVLVLSHLAQRWGLGGDLACPTQPAAAEAR